MGLKDSKTDQVSISSSCRRLWQVVLVLFRMRSVRETVTSGVVRLQSQLPAPVHEFNPQLLVRSKSEIKDLLGTVLVVRGSVVPRSLTFALPSVCFALALKIMEI